MHKKSYNFIVSKTIDITGESFSGTLQLQIQDN